MTDVFFTSDHHFGHQKVADIRGFSSPGAHDAAVIERHNDTVRPDDVVWMLGDLSSGTKPATHEALSKVRLMHGRKRLVYGNHCPGHPMHRDAWQWQRAYLETFQSAQPFGRVSINGVRVLLSHFPYHADREETRYPQYRLPARGQPLLHGHLHSLKRLTSREEIHVGLDAWDLTPVSSQQIVDLMPARWVRESAL